MGKYSTLVAILLLGCLIGLLLGGWQQRVVAVPEPTRQKWEYMTKEKVKEKEANELGKDGWEMVLMEGYWFWFKRAR
jgi:hypothetical protein